MADFTSLNWKLCLAHGSTYILLFFCLINGIRSSGKVVYLTVSLPYLLLTILFVYGISLDGSWQGISFFLYPQWNRLIDYNVWLEAFIQVLDQLGTCWGALITMSRYNDFHQKVYKDAFIIPLANMATAIYGGLALFAILGNMSFRYNVPVGNVVGSGPALAFVGYPEAISQLPFSFIWAMVFFLMLISVAIDTQLAIFETALSGIIDMFPKIGKTSTRKRLFTLFLLITIFLISLPLCSKSGIYIYQLLDWYSAVITVTICGLLECLIIGYIYGIDRFNSDVKLMFGKCPHKIISILWRSITPIILAIIAFFGLANLSPPSYSYTSYTVISINYVSIFNYYFFN